MQDASWGPGAASMAVSGRKPCRVRGVEADEWRQFCNFVVGQWLFISAMLDEAQALSESCSFVILLSGMSPAEGGAWSGPWSGLDGSAEADVVRRTWAFLVRWAMRGRAEQVMPFLCRAL